MPKSAFNCSDFFLRASDNGTNGKYEKWVVEQFIEGISCSIPVAIFYGDNCEKYARDHAERLNQKIWNQKLDSLFNSEEL